MPPRHTAGHAPPLHVPLLVWRYKSQACYLPRMPKQAYRQEGRRSLHGARASRSLSRMALEIKYDIQDLAVTAIYIGLRAQQFASYIQAFHCFCCQPCGYCYALRHAHTLRYMPLVTYAAIQHMYMHFMALLPCLRLLLYGYTLPPAALRYLAGKLRLLRHKHGTPYCIYKAAAA